MKSFYFKLLSIFLISCLGIIVYSNTFHSSFHFDDIRFIVNNLAIRDLYNLQNIWHYYHGRFFTFLSLAFCYHFCGLDVFGYHLFNLAVHIANAILVYWLVLLTLSTPAFPKSKVKTIVDHANLLALLAGLIFVAHPVAIEAVTNIWQRAASMAALFYLLSLCLYIRSRLLAAKAPSWGFYYIGSLIAAIVAMFTKENTITLPLMILSYEFCFLKTNKPLNWKYLAPFLLTIFIIPITSTFFKTATFNDFHGNLNRPEGIITPMHYFLTQFRALVTYIRLVFIPINQNLDYDYPVFKSFFELPVFCSFLFLLAILYGTQRLFLKYRLVSFFIFWFFLTLTIPESSFWVLGDVISEHRLYLPLAGYSIFLVSGMYYLLGRRNIKLMVIVLLSIIAIYSVLAYQRNDVWRDDFSLWSDAVSKSPHKGRPYSYRGSAYLDQGNMAAAIADYNKAIELDPNDVQSYNNRGNIYVKQGKFTQALADFNKVIQATQDLAEPYYNRGVIYVQEGEYSKAIADYNKAIDINPDYVAAYANRGSTYAQEGNFSQALIDFNKVIEMLPSNAQALYNRGLVYGKEGKVKEALSDYNKVIDLDPNYGPAYNNLAILYFQLKEYDNAWSYAQKAQGAGYALNPGFVSALKQVLPMSSPDASAHGRESRESGVGDPSKN